LKSIKVGKQTRPDNSLMREDRNSLYNAKRKGAGRKFIEGKG